MDQIRNFLIDILQKGDCKACEYALYFFIGLGAFSTLMFTKSFLSFYGHHLLMPNTDVAKRYKTGTWVAITGSSDGIGAEYAREFARKGFNVVLMGRSKEKMSKVHEEIKKINPNVQVKEV